MHCAVYFRGIRVNVANQNAGVFVGEIRLPGADASQKVNSAHAAIRGSCNVETRALNVVYDGCELVDGIVFDGDHKAIRGYHA